MENNQRSLDRNLSIVDEYSMLSTTQHATTRKYIKVRSTNNTKLFYYTLYCLMYSQNMISILTSAVNTRSILQRKDKNAFGKSLPLLFAWAVPSIHAIHLYARRDARLASLAIHLTTSNATILRMSLVDKRKKNMWRRKVISFAPCPCGMGHLPLSLSLSLALPLEMIHSLFWMIGY